MKTVFVVLCEAGEYSQRDVWVGGVFPDRAAAEAAILTATAKRREYDQWHERYLRALYSIKKDRLAITTDAEAAEAKRATGPEPEYEAAERADLLEVMLGVWQVDR